MSRDTAHRDSPPPAHAEAPLRSGTDPPPQSTRAGLEALFREYNDFLVRVLTDRLHSAQEAREVAQEAYARLLGLDNPNAPSYLKALLFRTAINIANDRWKHNGRKNRLEPLVLAHIAGEQSRLTPDEECVVREELEIVRQALEELSPKCREVFLLHRVDGLTLKDASERMGVSRRQGLRYLHTALEHCALRLDSRQGSPGRVK